MQSDMAKITEGGALERPPYQNKTIVGPGLRLSPFGKITINGVMIVDGNGLTAEGYAAGYRYE